MEQRLIKSMEKRLVEEDWERLAQRAAYRIISTIVRETIKQPEPDYSAAYIGMLALIDEVGVDKARAFVIEVRRDLVLYVRERAALSQLLEVTTESPYGNY